MNDKMTAENFFENYNFSYWIFFVAAIVVGGSFVGGFGVCSILSIIFKMYLSDIINIQPYVIFLVFLVVLFFSVGISNLVHIHTGKPKYTKVNKINIYIQLAIYSISLFIVDLSDNWWAFIPVIFTLLSLIAFKSTQYQTFITCAQTIRQDWTGWQRCYAQWLTDKFNKFTSE